MYSIRLDSTKRTYRFILVRDRCLHISLFRSLFVCLNLGEAATASDTPLFGTVHCIAGAMVSVACGVPYVDGRETVVEMDDEHVGCRFIFVPGTQAQRQSKAKRNQSKSPCKRNYKLNIYCDDDGNGYESV